MFARLLALSLGLSSPPFHAAATAAPPEEESSSPDALGRLHELEAAVRPIAERLLACASEESFLAALDTELLRLEPLSLFLAFVLEIEPDEITSTLASAASGPDNVLDDFVAVTSPSHREELGRGFADAARMALLLFRPGNPDFAKFRELLADRPEALASAMLSNLGQVKSPLGERRAQLAGLRSNICTFVLAAASETRTRLPAWMADLCVRLWRQGQEQILARLEHRPAPPLREERLTPLSAVLLSFSCREPAVLARAVTKHPTLVPLLQQVPANLARFFPEGSIDHLRLRPSPGPESPEEDVVLVDVYVDQHDLHARRSLDWFDDAWWFDASRESTAEVIVDIRRT